MSDAEPTAADPNGYSVHVSHSEGGWDVQILEPGGEVAMSRRCGDEAEARTFASTVQQHIYWLSPEKFREYYRLGAQG